MKRHTLALKPGLKWTGSLDVIEALADGHFVVAFDAQDATHNIYDHTVMDAKLLEDWTGVPVASWWPQDAKGRPPKHSK